MKLAKKIFSFKEESAFQTWLYRIVINTAKDYTKQQERKRVNEMKYKKEQQIKYGPHQDEMSMADNIHQMIECLPQKLKETALLIFTEGMTHKEAAVVLDCAEKTISWRIYQVKKELAETIK